MADGNGLIAFRSRIEPYVAFANVIAVKMAIASGTARRDADFW
jgi:hypothetical protein